MIDWLQRARREILKTSDQHTADTAERNLTSVLAGRQSRETETFGRIPAATMTWSDIKAGRGTSHSTIDEAVNIAGTWRRLFGFSRPVEEIQRQLTDLYEWESRAVRVSHRI